MIQRTTLQLRVARGSLSVGLASLLDPLACGPDLEAAAREAVMAFSECERFLDLAAARLVDLLGDRARLSSSPAVIDPRVELVALESLARLAAPAASAGLVEGVEREVRLSMRSMGMSLALLCQRQLAELGAAVAQNEPGEFQNTAIAVHSELLGLAIGAQMDADQRHPFKALWPRVVGQTVAAAPRPSPPVGRVLKFERPAPSQPAARTDRERSESN